MRGKAKKYYETPRRNTELLLAGALKELMSEKPLSKISIRELTEHCGLNRKTFYYHFEDIYALLRWTIEHDAMAEFEGAEQCRDAEELLAFFIQYTDRNRKQLHAVLNAMNGVLFEQVLYNGFHRVVRLRIEQIEQEQERTVSEEYREFVLEFYVNALSSCFMRYVQQHKPATQEEMMDYTGRILQYAIPAALQETPKKVIP